MDEDDVEIVNILLLGPIHAGKTSFFNTISSVFQERISHIGRTGEETKSLTLKFRKYPIFTTKENREVRFRLCDCRGMEDVNSVLIEDIEAIVDGHMKDGYTLNSEKPIDDGDEFYEANPKLADRIHVVVFVIDSNNDPAMLATSEVMSQIDGVTNKLNRRDIPQFVLMNKVDGLNPDIRKDVELLFRYQSIKTRLDKIARSMKVTPSNVLPMCNYFEGTETDTKMDILTLYNIQQMLRMADDYLKNFKRQIDKGKPLKTPWKKVDFSQEVFEIKRKEVDQYSPRRETPINVLLLGPTGSGKADFVNSVNYSIHRRITAFDVASGHSSQRLFIRYKKIRRKDGRELAVQFCDCLGFENISDLRSKVLQQILDEKVKHGTQIDVDNIDTIEDQEVQNRVHFVLFVIPATIALGDVKNQYSQLRETVGRSGIPQLVLLTKVDTFRRGIRKSPEKIYVDAKAKECIEKISKEIDVRIIRPMVHNDSDEFSEAHGILCLDVMQDITAAVDEYLQNLPEDQAGCVIC